MKIEQGQVAVVTGGASGIGFALAEELGRRGCRLVIADIRSDALAHAGEQLRAAGHDVVDVITDVSDPASVQALADTTIDRYGRVDVVCNNAGVVGPIAPMWEQSLRSWERLVDIKLMGVVHGVRSFAPLLVAAGRGHILNTASAGGLIVLPGMTPYNATMHAVVGLTETLDVELRKAAPGLGSTVLCPGRVATDLEKNSIELDDTDALASTAKSNAAEGLSTDPGLVVSAADTACCALDAVEAGRVHAILGRRRSAGILDRVNTVVADLVAGD
ncbi:SDR family NAD(P)-dependent oxidoreductase [Gordonia humi]|uniref:NAD(P)-dependent dehydrogenase (Short-subunit alcohol dehydrogenase family) n=1 Tax=Gordonia humi TaxID=686429 RepID=A0A840F4C9_9ACTN|nr:NAD(P)-dependent dehydrogenase (short-subunit alcohol dehydrogenase family) [Gordonia humi]